MAASFCDLRLDPVERVLLQEDRGQGAQEGRGGLARPEMLLDDGRERLPRLLVAGQEFIGVQVNGNGLYCHALTVHFLERRGNRPVLGRGALRASVERGTFVSPRRIARSRDGSEATHYMRMLSCCC